MNPPYENIVPRAVIHASPLYSGRVGNLFPGEPDRTMFCPYGTLCKGERPLAPTSPEDNSAIGFRKEALFIEIRLNQR